MTSLTELTITALRDELQRSTRSTSGDHVSKLCAELRSRGARCKRGWHLDPLCRCRTTQQHSCGSGVCRVCDEPAVAQPCSGGREAHQAHLMLNGECPWCGLYDPSQIDESLEPEDFG